MIGARGTLIALAITAPAFAQAPLPDARTASPSAIAAALLDASRDQPARDALARDAAARAADVVQALVAGLPDRDVDEQYRRIPWIWRVSVAAGRAGNADALMALLDATMPASGSRRLHDWQAVVLGGGVVMGLSQGGRWPDEALAPWMTADPSRAARWATSLDLAVVMADDASVRNGTRYDALRMLAVLPWTRVGPLLTRYLSRSVDAELQMGAIGALSDMRDARAVDALVRHVAEYTERNRGLAITALLRTDAGKASLESAIASGAIREAWLTPEQQRRR